MTEQSVTGFRTGRWAILLAVILGVTAAIYWLQIPTTATLPSFEPGVMLLRYNELSASTEQREQGFLETMKNEFPDIPIIDSVQYLGATRDLSVLRSRQLIEDFGESYTAVFTVCEANTEGCLQALEELGLSGSIPHVGFDSSALIRAALSQRKLQGVVMQDPVKMGYEAVNAALQSLKGDEVEKRIATKHIVATADNLDSPELQLYLYPDRFSGEHFTPDKVDFTIGVIAKGLTHSYWQSIRAGAERAALESGNTSIRFEAPVLEQDVDGQIDLVNRMIDDKVSAICLAPIESTSLGEVVLKASKAGIPVVIFDSGLDEESNQEALEAIVSYVSTDNYAAGADAARLMAATIKGK